MVQLTANRLPCRREMEKMKDAVNAAAGGDGISTRRIAGDAGREYILQTEEDTKAKAALEAGAFVHVCIATSNVLQL